MEVKRGDLVTIAVSGDYGKPRPALVIQDNAFRALESVAVLRVTSDLHDWPLFRVTVHPAPENGLQKPSRIMIDKPVAVPKGKVGRRIGYLDEAQMTGVDSALRRFLGLS